MASKSEKKAIHGVFLCDKPLGVSSNFTLQKVKRVLQAKKAGHTGSLDPLASGVLPLCFGEATKFAQFGLESVKCYEVVAQFGIGTETGDTDGDICEDMPRPSSMDEQQVRECIQSFVGVQYQTPNKFSALKFEGKPLYEYARQGIEVPIPSRQICVSQIDLHEINLDNNTATFWVCCSKGTYIRSLVQDIGAKLGWCAHVTLLRRTHAGLFDVQSCADLDWEAMNPDAASSVLNQCLPVSTLLLNANWWLVTGDGESKLDNGHAVLLSEAVCINHLKSKFKNALKLANINIGQSTDKMMDEFYEQQKNAHKMESRYHDRPELSVIYTIRAEHDMSLEALVSLCDTQVQNVLRLRGLVEVTDECMQPRRMINQSEHVF